MIKLVAFDWNGTLFADTDAILFGVNKIMDFLDLKRITLKDFQRHFDVPVVNTYLALGIPEEIIQKRSKELARNFHTNYEPRAEKVRTRAYAKRLLVWLFKKHISMIIFSNHLDEPIRKQLKRLKIEKYFKTVLANDVIYSTLKKRSKQKKLKSYIKQNNFKTNEVLVIGDTVEEIEIGKNLGVLTIALIDGNCSVERLKKAKPDYLISSLKQVIGIISGIS